MHGTSTQTRVFHVDEYYRMAEHGILGPDERVELIEGEILPMSPAGSRHAACINRLNALLGAALMGKAVVSVQNPIRLGDLSEPEPDVALLRPRDDFYASGHPTAEDVWLLIEVAESSLSFDRGTKLGLYARHGVRETWIVDLSGEAVHVHRNPHGDAYDMQLTVRRGDTVSPDGLPSVGLTVDQVLGPA